MSLDWLFQPTDNINLIIEVAVGLVATAWVAGWWSKRKLTAFLNSEESDPYIERIIGKIPPYPKVPEIPAYPQVPSVGEITEAVLSKLPPFPDIPEVPDFASKFGELQAKLDLRGVEMKQAIGEALSASMGPVLDTLSVRMSQQINAALASLEASKAATAQRAINQYAGMDPRVGMMAELVKSQVSKKHQGLVSLLMQTMGPKMAGGGNGMGQVPPNRWQPGAVETTPQGTFMMDQTGNWRQIGPAPSQLPMPAAPPMNPPSSGAAVLRPAKEVDKEIPEDDGAEP